MIALRILKILFLGIVGQIFVWSLLTLIGSPKLGGNMYWVWIEAGEWLFPSGAGGHALPGGAMLGLFVGFLTYALLLGFGIDRLIKWYLVKRNAWF